jgi:hypothetical protein
MISLRDIFRARVKHLLSIGYPVPYLAQYFGLSDAQVLRIKNEYVVTQILYNEKYKRLDESQLNAKVVL